jgi:hypothetical protein
MLFPDEGVPNFDREVFYTSGRVRNDSGEVLYPNEGSGEGIILLCRYSISQIDFRENSRNFMQ